MITAPTNWETLAAASGSHLEIKVDLDGDAYYNEDLAAGDCKITHALYDAFSIGNAAAAEFSVTILDLHSLPDGILPIDLYCRLKSADGQTTTAWVPQGKFYVDDVRINRDGDAAITAYDALMLAEQDYDDGDTVESWPKPASAVVSHICSELGVSLDSRSVIPSVQIQYPEGMTMRDVLREVAVAGCGNWTMTKDGELRLVKIRGNTRERSLEDISVGDIESTSNATTISQIILKDGSASYSSGTTTGYTVEASFRGADQTMADSLLAACRAVPYQGYNVTDGYFSPLLELGDPVSTTIGQDTYYYMFDSYSALYEEGCWGDIYSPLDTTVNHRIRFSHSQGSKTPEQKAAEQAVQDVGFKVVSVASLPATQDPNTIYLVQGTAG